MAERFFIVDGMAIAYRAHFALIRQPLVTSDGRHVSATHGFLRAILKLIKDENPDYIAIAFDSREKTFRHQKYPEYKATREKMPFEMVPQIGWIKEVVEAMNIPLLEMPGWEADDIIGTLALKARERGLQSFMVTGDKDFMQLVNEDIFMYSPATGRSELTVYDAEKVREKWGVGPERIVDLLALMGDSSDNVPGIPGVGEKTAVKLLTQYGSFDEVLAHAEEQKNARVREGLKKGRESGILSRELVTIDTDVPVDIDWDSLRRGAFNSAKLEELLRSFEFFSLLRELVDSPGQAAGQAAGQASGAQGEKPAAAALQSYQVITEQAQLQTFLGQLKEQTCFAFDTETDSTEAMEAELIGMSFSWQTGEAFYLPLRYAGKDAEIFDAEDDRRAVLDMLKPILESPAVEKVGQNIKYDALVLVKYGIRMQGLAFDTMVAEYILNPDSNSYKLDNLAEQYLHYRMQPIEELIGKGREQISMALVDRDRAGWYACEDADVTWQLYGILKERLKKEGLETVFYDIDMPLVDVLVSMEAAGMHVNTDFLKDMSGVLEKDLAESEEGIYALAGEEFNINSPGQLAVILFEKLGLKPVKKTKTGFSTDVTVLEQLQHEHPLPAKILEYRGLAKLKSTYVDAIPQLRNTRTGRIHSSFNQTVAATGRLSSTNPNLQNIPIRSERGREIRKAFVPGREGWQILAADYSQVELRIVAHLSGDENLIRAFREDMDIHAATAALIFGTDPGLVSSDMRRTAKVVNFGILYGAGPFRISQELGISRADAAGIIKAYFDSYRELQTYIDETTAFAEEHGYVETLFGRRRGIRDISSTNRNLREAAKRILINMPVQGTAADLIKVAMNRLHAKFRVLGLKSMMISQVHDELIFEVAADEMDIVRETVRFEMEHAVELKVPLKVDIGSGRDWFECK